LLFFSFSLFSLRLPSCVPLFYLALASLFSSALLLC